jgi:hypothetical protein
MDMDSQSAIDIRIESVRLADGRRVFRIIDPGTGLCLERAADPAKPVHLQTRNLLEAMKALRSMPVCTAA